MVTLMLRYAIGDEATFTPVFEEFEAVRRRHGATGHRRYRDLAGPGRVTVLIDFPGEAEAAAFLADPGRPSTLERAGIRGEERSMLEPVEDRAY